MMDYRRIVSILALALCVSATADIVTVIDAVETSAANVNVPTSLNGRLTFKPCAEACDEEFVSVRLTPETQFVVRGQQVNFADFRRAFYKVPRNRIYYALVSYDTENRTVTSVHLGE
jgi:hypothetical protein